MRFEWAAVRGRSQPSHQARAHPPPPAVPPCRTAVAFVNICKAATPLATLAVGLVARLEPRSKLTLLATLMIAVGTAIATASEAATGALAPGQAGVESNHGSPGPHSCTRPGSPACSAYDAVPAPRPPLRPAQATSAGCPSWPLPPAWCLRACAWCSRSACWARCGAVSGSQGARGADLLHAGHTPQGPAPAHPRRTPRPRPAPPLSRPLLTPRSGTT